MQKGTTYDVFISYRRQGGAVKAELTKDELAKRGFRDSRMFLDTRSLTSGNYLKTILDAIEGSRNIVVIVTKDCFKNLPTDSRPPIPAEYPVAKNAAHLLAENACVFWRLLEVLSARQRPRLIRRNGEEYHVRCRWCRGRPGKSFAVKDGKKQISCR